METHASIKSHPDADDIVYHEHLELPNNSVNIVIFGDGRVHIGLWEKGFEGNEPINSIEVAA